MRGGNGEPFYRGLRRIVIEISPVLFNIAA